MREREERNVFGVWINFDFFTFFGCSAETMRDTLIIFHKWILKWISFFFFFISMLLLLLRFNWRTSSSCENFTRKRNKHSKKTIEVWILFLAFNLFDSLAARHNNCVFETQKQPKHTIRAPSNNIVIISSSVTQQNPISIFSDDVVIFLFFCFLLFVSCRRSQFWYHMILLKDSNLHLHRSSVSLSLFVNSYDNCTGPHWALEFTSKNIMIFVAEPSIWLCTVCITEIPEKCVCSTKKWLNEPLAAAYRMVLKSNTTKSTLK